MQYCEGLLFALMVNEFCLLFEQYLENAIILLNFWTSPNSFILEVAVYDKRRIRIQMVWKCQSG